jgi:hypothetical protein
MPKKDYDQVIGPDGEVISETIVDRPVKVIGEAERDQAIQTLRSMVAQFWQDGAPTGTPTNVQLRNWCLALTVAVRYLANETDA